MDQLHLYSSEERQQEKHFYHSFDSLSPTPSPIPANPHLNFTHTPNPPLDQEMLSSIQQLNRSGRRNRKSSQQGKPLNRGHWSTQQNKKYHWFLEIHFKHFVNRHLRRMDKIFKSMEIFIGTRQAEQCRSHHQKMEKKYAKFITIISNLRNLHYNTIDVEPIMQDMASAAIPVTDRIATIEQLGEHQRARPVNIDYRERKRCPLPRVQREPAKQMKEQNKCQLEKVQEQKSQQLNFHANMLDESNINIGEFILYNEKEDNSCIFNSFFK